jgi:hypothetical protein
MTSILSSRQFLGFALSSIVISACADSHDHSSDNPGGNGASGGRGGTTSSGGSTGNAGTTTGGSAGNGATFATGGSAGRDGGSGTNGTSGSAGSAGGAGTNGAGGSAASGGGAATGGAAGSGGSAATNGASGSAGSAGTAGTGGALDGIAMTSALKLSSNSVAIGGTLTGNATIRNVGSSNVTLPYVIIAARPPGGTHTGGPFLNLYQIADVSLGAGQSVQISGGRPFAASDPVGNWYAYLTFQTPSGTWNDFPPDVNFSVTPGTGGGRVCNNPVFTTSDPNGGWTNGGYYVHNNMWNQQEAGPETLYACAYNNWYVESRQPNTTSVKTYPNVHLDINNLNGAPLANYTTIRSTFAGTGPRVGIYNIAYDIWLNGVGWGGGTTEFMIWTENFNQRPLGSLQVSVTFGGVGFDAWHYNNGDANVVSLVAKSTLPSGTFNLKEMLDWAIARGWVPSNPTINQIGYGVEICSTNNMMQRFTFTDFSVTMN